MQRGEQQQSVAVGTLHTVEMNGIAVQPVGTLGVAAQCSSSVA